MSSWKVNNENSVSDRANPWVIVAGGFHREGGMDKANLALAEYLIDTGTPVHVVCHSVDPDLSRHRLVTVHQVQRPAGSFLLGEPLLDLAGRKVARRVIAQWPRAVVVVNGGNCIWPDVNWVHYVHHAWKPDTHTGPAWFRAKAAASDWLQRRRERRAIQKARLLITNSNLTSRHLVEHLDADPSRIRTVYLGGESEWGATTPEERALSRSELQIPESRAVAVFVGAMGYDQRKGFDVLFEAWRLLCTRPEWDVDLLAAGSGSAIEMWQARVAACGLEQRIRLLGFSRRIDKLLAAADLLVSPVRYEAYGLNVQEAICRGVPAMVSTTAGVAERYGAELREMLIEDPENAGELVDRLWAWRERREDWRARFEPLGKTLRGRGWPDMAREMAAIIRQQCAAGAGHQVFEHVAAGGKPVTQPGRAQ